MSKENKPFDIYISSDKRLCERYTFVKMDSMGSYFGTDNENKDILYCMPIYTVKQKNGFYYDTEDIHTVDVWYKDEEKQYQEINNILGINFKSTDAQFIE